MPLLAALLALASQTGVVEVPFRKGENTLVVDAIVNGRKVALLFDSGYAGTVILNKSVDVGPVSGKAGVVDFVGQSSMDTVKLKSMSVGGRAIPFGAEDEILQADSDFSTYDNPADGILGLSAIKDVTFTIDFQHSKFIFYPKGYDVSGRTSDNKTTFMEKLLPIGNRAAQMPVRTLDGKSMTMTLDTGNANFATSHPDILERVGLWHQGKDVKFAHLSGIASGAVESFSIKMPALNIFGIPTPESVWDVINLPSATAEGDGTVGYQFLKHFNITMDYPHRRVFFENWEQPITNRESGEAGLWAATYPEMKRVLVYSVTPGGPAEKAGIKRGDTILSVDGDELDRVTPVQFRKLMEGKEGSTVRVVYSHEGSLKRAELTRALLVNESETPTKAQK